MKAVAQPGSARRPPPRAVVGSQISFEEEMFGAAFNGQVVRRFWAFVAPHRKGVWIGMAAVLVFTLTQIAIPSCCATRSTMRSSPARRGSNCCATSSSPSSRW